VNSPTPFLTTMIGLSGGMFSIVSGFLISRYVSLDSDQQTVERELHEIEEQLKLEQERARATRSELLRAEAEWFLDDFDVIEAIGQGITDAESLRRRANTTPLSDAELHPFINELREEYLQAFQTLNDALQGVNDLSPKEWDDLRDFWQVRTHLKEIPTELPHPDVWAEALNKIIDQRKKAAERRQEAQRAAARRRTPSMPDIGAASLVIPNVEGLDLRRVRSASADAATLRRLEDLRSSASRSDLKVEDLEGDVERLRRRLIVIPDRQLWRGLAMLATLVILGIGLPLYILSQGPSDLTPLIKSLAYPFGFALLLLLTYLFSFALSLARRAKRREKDYKK
jgi:hypothetical protein